MTDSEFYLWLFTVGTLIGSFLFLSFKTTPQLAIGIVVGCSMIAPAWFLVPLFDTPNGTIVASGLDVKLAVTASCLVLYCFMPKRTFPLKLIPSDFAMIALVAVHFISDITNSGFSWIIIARIYAEWFAPYVAGRLALQEFSVPNYLWKTIAIASALIGLLAVIESIFHVNCFELIAGERPLEGASRDAKRWNIYRAYGPTMHPIYLGGLQILLFAWPVYGAIQALNRKVSYLWVFLPILSILGILSTGSRAPIIGLAVFAATFVFFSYPASRIPIVTFSSIMGLLIGINFWWVIEKLEDWSGETRLQFGQKVQIEGEKVKYTGLRTRILMLDVYRIAIVRSGLLGYGTIATSGFPVNVPISGQEIKTLKRVQFIDNAYILLLLRFGYAGLASLSIAFVACIAQFFLLSRSVRSIDLTLLIGVLSASLVSCYFIIATVWMPQEIGFPLLWTMGISSGLFTKFKQR